MAYPSYTAPPAKSSSADKLGWIKESIQEARNFLQSQPAYSEIDKSVGTIMGMHEERIPKTLSNVAVNRGKRQVREVVAMLANINPLWSYKTDNKLFDQHVNVQNKMLRAWWQSSFADRKVRDALQYSAGEGTGYIIPLWSKDYWVAGRGDIKFHTVGSRDVLPVQIGRDNDLQQAYAVSVRAEIPINKARATYPLFADLIVPDRSSPGFLRRGVRKVQKHLAPVLNLAGKDKEYGDPYFPVVDIFYTYILDLTINTTDRMIPMGQPGTSWYYEVPPYNSEIQDGVDRKGDPVIRRATFEDARLYPLRRLMISTKTALIYDDTSYWFHGKVPVIPFKLDDWVWSFLGLPLLRDVSKIHNDNNELFRAITDSAKARLRPPIEYDENIISKALMERFDPRQAGQTVGYNKQMGKGIEPILQADFYNVPNWIPEHIEKMEQRSDHLIGLADVMALARARALPAGDSIDKFMEMVGPVIQDSSRNMERSLRDCGEIWKGLAFQFYNTSRRVQVLGPNGIVEEDFDYEPGLMIPSHLAHENKNEPSRYTLVERAKRHQNNFFLYIVPHSLHEITQITRKMLHLQLQRTGFPIDPWTMAEVMELDNFGPAPTGTNNMIERWVAWQRMQMELRLDLERMLQKALAEAQQASQPGGGEDGTGTPYRGVLEGLLNPSARGTGGRPPSGKKAPRMQTKDGGSRTTIAESK